MCSREEALVSGFFVVKSWCNGGHGFERLVRMAFLFMRGY